MAPRAMDFKTALITGGAGGIGYAMAEHFLAIGKKVILAGRTESKLAEAASRLGRGTTYYVLDTGDVARIPAFVAEVLRAHPDLDCVVNNAGVQRPFDIVAGLDLAKADQEIDINIRGPLHLAVAFLPHLRQKRAGATIINVSSLLGFNPFSIVNPVYNGTKAWLHFWSMNLRTQLAASADTAHIAVVEIAPPTVATDLHRERADPDDNKKHKNPAALDVKEFVDIVAKALDTGHTTIGAGVSVDAVQKWYATYGDAYDKSADKYIEDQRKAA